MGIHMITSARMALVLGAALATSTTSGCIIVWPGPGPGPGPGCYDCSEDEGSFDDDGDGFSNADEDACGSDRNNVDETCDDLLDSDGDGRINRDEEARGTDPWNPDTDGDGDDDGAEEECVSSPLDPQFTCAGDGDGTNEVCWWIGDWLAMGQTCTLNAPGLFIQEMPAEGCADVTGPVEITCYSTDGEEACTCQADGGDDVIVDEGGCT